jgi:hypothetical protein
VRKISNRGEEEMLFIVVDKTRGKSPGATCEKGVCSLKRKSEGGRCEKVLMC